LRRRLKFWKVRWTYEERARIGKKMKSRPTILERVIESRMIGSGNSDYLNIKVWYGAIEKINNS